MDAMKLEDKYFLVWTLRSIKKNMVLYEITEETENARDSNMGNLMIVQFVREDLSPQPVTGVKKKITNFPLAITGICTSKHTQNLLFE